MCRMDDGLIGPLQKSAGRRPQDATGAVPGLTEADRSNVATIVGDLSPVPPRRHRAYCVIMNRGQKRERRDHEILRSQSGASNANSLVADACCTGESVLVLARVQRHLTGRRLHVAEGMSILCGRSEERRVGK